MKPGAIVLLNLSNPSEKFWGVLLELLPVGVTFRGIGVDSFEDWMRQVARHDAQGLGLATMFVPLLRVERMFLDEPVGEVESYCQRFERHVGVAVETYLDPVAL